MNQGDIRLVQESFAQVSQDMNGFARTFYDRLFELDPTLESLFGADMVGQGKKLTDMLQVIVVNLPNLQRIMPAITKLGERHIAYGVRDAHYVTVGAALIDSLEKVCGSSFTADAREAWAKAYRVLATTMMEGAYAADASPRAH